MYIYLCIHIYIYLYIQVIYRFQCSFHSCQDSLDRIYGSLDNTHPPYLESVVTNANDITTSTLQHIATHCNTLQDIATHCNTLQHTATHRNTPQHTATHCTPRVLCWKALTTSPSQAAHVRWECVCCMCVCFHYHQSSECRLVQSVCVCVFIIISHPSAGWSKVLE